MPAVRSKSTSIKKTLPKPYCPGKQQTQVPLSGNDSSLQSINQLKEASKEAHLRAKKTKDCYAGHVRRGRKWLEKHFHPTPTQDSSDSEPQMTSTVLVSSIQAANTGDDPYQDPDFQHAFDSIPNRMSDKAVALFLTYKGVYQNLSQGTVEGVRAAFKALWDNADRDTYRGRWHFNDAKQHWQGNPVNSAKVDDMTSSLKHRASAGGNDHRHAKAMSKGYMARILDWSRRVCPDLDAALRWLQHKLAGKADADRLCTHVQDWALVTRHLEQIAFSAVAWILWTRCDELVKLSRSHVDIDDPAAVDRVLRKCLAGEELLVTDLEVKFEVHLANRKGWQKKVDKGQIVEQDLRCNRYNIYPRAASLESPATDAFVWLLVWIKWLELTCYDRELSGSDCLFPFVSGNGVVHSSQPISHETVQKWIDEAVAGARIPGPFSMHCFRRGGAQHRFMFAPCGQRWTLAKVRWWGGWAENEKRDTLSRYLLNELHAYETGYSDALAPFPREADQSLAGEAALVRQPTVEEMRMNHASYMGSLHEMKTEIVGEIAGLLQGTLVRAAAQSGLGQCTSSRLSDGRAAVADAGHATSTGSEQMTAATTTTTNHAPSLTPVRDPESSSPTNPSANRSRPGSAQSIAATGPGATTQTADAPPTMGQYIPTPAAMCPAHAGKSKKDAWREVVRHWVSGLPELGLDTPLKDWPEAWWSRGENRRKFGVQRHNCATIAKEFLEAYRSDKARFLATYPEAERGITPLLNAIKAARLKRGETASEPTP